MEVLQTYYTQLDEIEKGLEQEAYRILANVQEQITQLNTDQLYKGLTPQGQRLKSYSPPRGKYAKAKNQMNPLPGLGNPDLKLTGNFYSEFYLTAKNKEFTLHSSDKKEEFLVKRYGKENIFGLTVENNKIVNYELLLPELLEWVLKKLKI